jgi:hypothetical protein
MGGCVRAFTVDVTDASRLRRAINELEAKKLRTPCAAVRLTTSVMTARRMIYPDLYFTPMVL